MYCGRFLLLYIVQYYLQYLVRTHWSTIFILEKSD